jgi:hypothetical protein
MRCACGREINTTVGQMDRYTIWDQGELVYAVCSHGIAYINKYKNKKYFTNKEISEEEGIIL